MAEGRILDHPVLGSLPDVRMVSLMFDGVAIGARPGETILIYTTGFGRTNPATPPGVVVGSGAAVVAPVTVRIGGTTAATQAFLSGVGLYQLNVTVPDNLLNGEHAVIATAGGIETQTGVVLPVRR